MTIRREWLLLALAFLLFGLFLGVFRLVAAGAVAPLDDAVLAAVKNLRGPVLDHAFLELTALGSVTVLTLISVSTLVFLLLDARPRPAFQLLLASTATSAITFLLKAWAERPRPPLADRLDLVSGFSFPSGHASSGAAIYLTLALLFATQLRVGHARLCFLVFVIGVILSIGFSRIYLGVHYATDAVGGLFLGAGVALLLHYLFHPKASWRVFR